MTGTITQRHVRLERDGADQDGCLIYLDDRLVSVLVRLMPGMPHPPELRHKWRVAAAYGPCAALPGTRVFDTPDEVSAWITRRVPPAPAGWMDAHLLP
ncbi:hypothetical protein OPKNFCMD_6275 [Methylobacterium crusticola]|uniref:Uncharacterized protein n=1 Tax=Methylobacterium crusticola TaxID=1697972 RepID=A0ABQ4R8R6_9HYPH|nr:hypothetical protein [Methylobacterium crusticola]GJD53499.1 hypothetical protein OPKNFCMD_6275 [Methylobacterium crusticola]